MAEVDKWTIDKPDSSNWMAWKFQMRHFLLSKGLWGLVDGSEVLRENPTPQQEAEFRKRSQRALSNLVMSISSSLIYLITTFEDPKAAWDAVKGHFEQNSVVNKLMLKK
uniref:Uncharacterized protein n=1 Tax=Amphimedon queenslandica TaxID=400682 RepID=A0A1X7UT02_AMPQE